VALGHREEAEVLTTNNVKSQTAGQRE